MYSKLPLTLIGILTIISLGCTKNLDLTPIKSFSSNVTIRDTITNPSDIYGTWINTSNPKDTIKISEGFIERWDISSSGYFHFYKYQISVDSILIKYTGLYKVGTPPYHRTIFINTNKDSILIRGFHSVYPSSVGDIFVKN
jgi:hypothetical protein